MRAQEVGVTGVPEQGLGREHPGSWPWRPGCWSQCKPDLLTRPAHAARVWSWQRPSVAGGPSLLSPRGHSRCGRSPASPLPPAWPAAQPLFALPEIFKQCRRDLCRLFSPFCFFQGIERTEEPFMSLCLFLRPIYPATDPAFSLGNLIGLSN